MAEQIHAGPGPSTIVELDDIDSTNAEAMRRAAAGERGPLWISALRQSAGRGRSGRSWASLDGNLMATLLTAPTVEPRRFGELALVAGVAAHEAITATAPPGSLPRLRLKWPNDILLGEAKIGGILVESTIYSGTMVAAVGFGINIAVPPSVPGRSTTALARHGTAPTRPELLQALSGRMAHWLDVWRAPAGFDTVRTGWLDRAGPDGEQTTINTGRAVVSGTFAGLDRDGALLIRDAAGGLCRFSFGDVTVAAELEDSERGHHGG